MVMKLREERALGRKKYLWHLRLCRIHIEKRPLESVLNKVVNALRKNSFGSMDGAEGRVCNE